MSVKLNISLIDFVSGHIVTAGNGIAQTGVDFSEKLTITGVSCHLSQDSFIKSPLQNVAITKAIIQKILSKCKTDEIN